MKQLLAVNLSMALLFALGLSSCDKDKKPTGPTQPSPASQPIAPSSPHSGPSQLPGTGDFITIPELFPGTDGTLVPKQSLNLDYATDIVWGSILGNEKADIVLERVLDDVPVLISGVLPIDGRDHIYLGIGRDYYNKHGGDHIYRALKKRFPLLPIYVEASDGAQLLGRSNTTTSDTLFSDTFDTGLDAWTTLAIFSPNPGWGTQTDTETGSIVAETQNCPWICNLVTATPLDLSSHESVTLSFDRWVDDDVSGKEGLSVLIGNDTKYKRLDRWSGDDGDGAWHRETYVIDTNDLDGDVFIRFSATTTNTYNHEPKRIAIDNVTLVPTSDTAVPEEEGESEEEPAPQSNLTVSSITVEPIFATSGDTLTIQVVLHNTGEATAPSQTVTIYRHEARTTTPETDGTAVGDITTNDLSAGTTATQTVSVPAPTVTRQTTHYYYACTDTTCANTPAFAVTQPAVSVPEEPEEEQEEGIPQPNLAISPVTATPTTVTPGNRITLSAQVAKTGTNATVIRTVRIYRHTEQTDSPRTGGLETKALGKIFLGDAPTDVTMGDTAPSIPATYYYYICVDALPEEQDTGDNCSQTPAKVTVQTTSDRGDIDGEEDVPEQAPQSHLTFSFIAATPTVIEFHETITISVAINNTGDTTVPSETVMVYRHLSETTTPESGGTSIGSITTGDLSAGATVQKSISTTAPPMTEKVYYYYYACIDTTCTNTPARVVVRPKPVSPSLSVLGGDKMGGRFIERDLYLSGGTITLGGLETVGGIKGFVGSAHSIAGTLDHDATDTDSNFVDMSLLDNNTIIVEHPYNEPETGHRREYFLGRVFKMPRVRTEGEEKVFHADAAFIAYPSRQTLGCSQTWKDRYHEVFCLDPGHGESIERVVPLTIHGDGTHTHKVVGSQRPTDGLKVHLHGSTTSGDVYGTVGEGKLLLQFADAYTYLYRAFPPQNGSTSKKGDSGGPLYTTPDENGNVRIVGIHSARFYYHEGELGDFLEGFAFSSWDDIVKELDLKPISP